MADSTSTLEADLFAALNGASAAEPEEPNHPPPNPPLHMPAPAPVSAPASVPTSAPSSAPSPAPSLAPAPGPEIKMETKRSPAPEVQPPRSGPDPQAAPPTQPPQVLQTAQNPHTAPYSQPIQHAQAAQYPQSTRDPQLAAASTATAQPPPAAQTPQPAVVPVVPSQQPPAFAAPSPKRQRSPEPLDSAKRQKTDQAELPGLAEAAENDVPSWDMAAMLQSALQNALGLEDQFDQPQENEMSLDSTNEPPPASSATATPGDEKSEQRIMKASSNSTYVMRSMSLPVLGNIAVQVLLRLSQQSRTDTKLLLADSESEFCKAYQILRDMFGHARKVFSDAPLLFPDELDISDSEDRETIRMSNLAAAAVSIFGANDVALADLHESFFSIFIQEDGEYKEPLTELFVSLKTKVLFAALGEREEPQHVLELVDKLFLADFEEILKQRSGDMALNDDEERLVCQIREKRELLMRFADNQDVKKLLESQLASEDNFAESLSVFLQSHLNIVVEYAEKYGVNIPLSEEVLDTDPIDLIRNGAQGEEHDDLAAMLQSATSGITQDHEAGGARTGELTAEQQSSLADDLDLHRLIEQSLSNHDPEPKDGLLDQSLSNDFSVKDLASLIAEKLNDGQETMPDGLPNLSASSYAHNAHETNNAPLHPQYLAHMNQLNNSAYQGYTQTPPQAAPTGAAGESLPPNQSSPTSVLYERARQAAVAKSSNTARREGLHSTRRPWTPEEEKALMAGLDMVKGPHWSQILSLFGINGSISDILKDRTQVQLKDKARNLKLFFLKTNSEMPYYLQSVTGELKTRAPSQAARKEAEEKARMNTEDEQARLQGVMTLAGGLHNNHHSIAGSPLAMSSSARASPSHHGVAGANGVATGTHAQGSTSHVPSQPPVPISPMVKSEPSEHHSIPHVSTLPHIQPAPALPVQPSLRPQPPPQQQQHSQHHQQHQNQQQQHQQHQQQHTQQRQQQQHQPPQQQQQQQHHQSPQQQQQQHQQSQVQQHGHSQSPQPLLPAPAPSQPRPQSHAQPPPSNTPNNQAYGLPPIPPNHHSTPDQIQDAKLFESLQAAISSENHAPMAVSEASAS
ncbi:telomere repeat binding factor-domain-containing protein [Cercophora scortea]|uniref:Telomere repeat binding factor-domain-containing protein n=1 Tax=Cercophora scortea TaxID=314031 RepID=A0AAE0I8V4_9PEZI|nr:telomere repeat binding factor-domain-containing protein [Cercophora scortea]